jgi:hypothetical protein
MDPAGRAHRAEVTTQMAADFRPDYGDCFSVATDPGIAARSWAIASLRGAAAANGAFARLVWDGLLGFELAPLGDPDALVGWRIRDESALRLELEADGSLMAGRMVFLVDRDRLCWATLLSFHKPQGRLIWSVAGHAHRAVAPRSLERAAQAMACSSHEDDTDQ